MSLATGTMVAFVLCIPPALALIQEDLGAGLAELQWVPNAYTLTQGALLVVGGSLGDRLGYRRVYVPALAAFGSGLLLCSLVSGGAALIGLAALLGSVSAMALGNALSVLAFAYPERSRAAALAGWGVGLAAFYAASPILGGAIAEYASWRLAFVVLGALAICAAVVGYRNVASIPATAPRAPDLPGALLLAVGLGLFVTMLIEGNRLGWGSAPIVLAGLGGTAALGTFYIWERRAQAPIFDFALLEDPVLRASTLATIALSAAFFAAVFYLPVYFSQILAASPLQAALMLLAATGTGLVAAAATVRLRRRFDDRRLLVVALGLMAAGMLLSARVDPGWSYSSFLPGLFLFGWGLGTLNGPLAALVAAAVGPWRSGMANSAVYSCRMIGSALGIAGFGALLQARIGDELVPTAGGNRAAVIEAVASGAVSRAAAELPPGARSAFAPSAHAAFVDGIGSVFLVLGLALVLVTLIAFLLLIPKPNGPRGLSARRSRAERPSSP